MIERQHWVCGNALGFAQRRFKTDQVSWVPDGTRFYGLKPGANRARLNVSRFGADSGSFMPGWWTIIRA